MGKVQEINYHDIKYHVSSSGLKLLQTSPRLFKAFYDGEYERKDTNYFDFGTLFHMYLLERKKFDSTVKVLNYNIPKSSNQKEFCLEISTSKKSRKIQDRVLEAYKNNYKATGSDEAILGKAMELYEEVKDYVRYLKESKRYTVISTSEMQKIENLAAAIHRHKYAYKLFYGHRDSIIDTGIDVYNEQIITWEEDGIKFKAMLDKVIVDRNVKKITLVDLKTTVDISNFEESYIKYGYDIQMAFYSKALLVKAKEIFQLEGEIDDYSFEVIIVPVDKKTEDVKTFLISERQLTEGIQKCSQLIKLAKWHFEKHTDPYEPWEYTKEYYEGDGLESLSI